MAREPVNPSLREAQPGPFLTIGRLSVKYRWLVVAVWIVAVAVIPQALPSLSSAVKNENTAFLPSNTPVVKASALAAPFQRQNSFSALLVAGRPPAQLSAADEAAFASAEQAVARVSGVLDVRDRGLSGDGQVRMALVELSGRGANNGGTNVFDKLHAAVGGVAAPAGLQLHFAGELAQSVDADKQQQHTQSLTQQLSLLFIIALLLVVFRAALAPLVTLLPAALSLVIAGPLIGEAAKAGLEVSGLTQIILIVIVLGAGTDYGLFLIFRVREALAHGVEPRDAVVGAVSRVGETITFSALTVIVALVSVILAQFGLYRGLGPGLAIGVAVTLVAGLTLLPALLAIFGRAVMWPSKPRPGHEYRGAWGGVAARIVARPVRTLSIGLVLFVALALVVLAYKPAGFGSQTAPSGSDSAKGQVLLNHFPVSVRNPTNIVMRLPTSAWEDPTPLATASAGLERQRVFTSVTGGLNPAGVTLPPSALTRLYRALGPPQRLPAVEPPALAARLAPALYAAYTSSAQFISANGRTIQFYTELRAGDPSSTAALNAIPAVRAAVTQVANTVGAQANGVAGEAAAAYDVSKISTSDLKRIVPLVLVVIAILLAILLRSLVAPVYLILSVGLSYLAALGLAILVFVEIAGDSGLNFVLPFFMFIFLMALGEDYNILVMTRIREEARHGELRDAVRRAIAASGGTVTSAGLVLAGTFAVLTVAGNSQTREIGLGLAAGVLLDTFLVRTLLIPSLVVLLGDRNWWPWGIGAPKERAPAPTPATGEATS
ncbi:MAG: MMPL family transporter [Solirubrobacterales bacterium]|nr:MMPL family transporter [Solirubrobacterales bacterium]